MTREEELRNTIATAAAELNAIEAANAVQKEAKQKEASEKIAVIVAEVYALLEKATAIADEFDVTFSFKPAYGMGGYYQPSNEWNQSNYTDEIGWVSSSSNC